MVIVVVVIGGVNLVGGEGIVIGVVLGVLLIEVICNLMILLGILIFW